MKKLKRFFLVVFMLLPAFAGYVMYITEIQRI